MKKLRVKPSEVLLFLGGLALSIAGSIYTLRRSSGDWRQLLLGGVVGTVGWVLLHFALRAAAAEAADARAVE